MHRYIKSLIASHNRSIWNGMSCLNAFASLYSILWWCVESSLCHGTCKRRKKNKNTFWKSTNSQVDLVAKWAKRDETIRYSLLRSRRRVWLHNGNVNDNYENSTTTTTITNQHIFYIHERKKCASSTTFMYYYDVHKIRCPVAVHVLFCYFFLFVRFIVLESGFVYSFMSNNLECERFAEFHWNFKTQAVLLVICCGAHLCWQMQKFFFISFCLSSIFEWMLVIFICVIRLKQICRLMLAWLIRNVFNKFQGLNNENKTREEREREWN